MYDEHVQEQSIGRDENDYGHESEYVDKEKREYGRVPYEPNADVTWILGRVKL